jgi:hypothetical protein
VAVGEALGGGGGAQAVLPGIGRLGVALDGGCVAVGLASGGGASERLDRGARVGSGGGATDDGVGGTDAGLGVLGATDRVGDTGPPPGCSWCGPELWAAIAVAPPLSTTTAAAVASGAAQLRSPSSDAAVAWSIMACTRFASNGTHWACSSLRRAASMSVM